MTVLAPTLQAFFTDRLIDQREASPHTIAAYRDTFRLLLSFLKARTGKAPSVLDLGELNADMIGEFLVHLRDERHNSPRTRNARLSAIHALFRYAAVHHPEHAGTIQGVLALPPARFEKVDIAFLEPYEVDALLAAPDRSRFFGRRDHALLALAIQTGLRASELTGLTRCDVHLGTGPHVRCVGKGRKHRSTPLTKGVSAVLRAWLAERGGADTDPLFATSRGRRLSTDAVALIVSKHVATAARSCPTLASKHVTPHVLRHTAAMRLLHAGVDSSTIALWLGHEHVETTQIYVHADQTIKERALARVAPLGVTPGRYRPSDTLLAFLEQLR
jgi:site-specific recombinase XerD